MTTSKPCPGVFKSPSQTTCLPFNLDSFFNANFPRLQYLANPQSGTSDLFIFLVYKSCDASCPRYKPETPIAP